MNVTAFLNKLLRAFPKEEHEADHVLYLLWEDTVHLAFEVAGHTLIAGEAVNELASVFWKLVYADTPKDELIDRIYRIRSTLLLSYKTEELSPEEEALLDELNTAAYHAVIERPFQNRK